MLLLFLGLLKLPCLLVFDFVIVVSLLGYNEVTAPQFKTNEQALSWKCWAIGTYEENYYRLKLKNHVLSMQNSVGLLLGIHRFKQKYLEKFRPRPNNTNIIRNFGC